MTEPTSGTGLPGNRNPLTGEETEKDISGNCPVAVMLNNIKQALPQSGNSKADFFFEIPEEGGITRIMALYQDIIGRGHHRHRPQHPSLLCPPGRRIMTPS